MFDENFVRLEPSCPHDFLSR